MLKKDLQMNYEFLEESEGENQVLKKIWWNIHGLFYLGIIEEKEDGF